MGEDTFAYTVEDSNGMVSQPTQVTIDVVPPTATIHAIFWIDANGNGEKDANEEPIAGATVELLDENGDPVPCPKKMQKANTLGASTAQEEIVYCVVKTKEDGSYTFENLPLGKYQLRFTLSAEDQAKGLTFTSQGRIQSNTITVPADVTANAATGGVVTVTATATVKCGCAGVASDSGDAMSQLMVLIMMMLTAILGLQFVRKQEN